MSSLKPFIAGVGTVVVALVVGFGGGMILAERFTSTTAVPEQSKIEKRNGEQREEASQKPAEMKSVLTETIKTPLSNDPSTAAPATFASDQPEQAASPPQAQQSAPQQNASPAQQPESAVERAETAGGARDKPVQDKPAQRERIREVAAPQEVAQPARNDPPAAVRDDSPADVSSTPAPRQQAAPPDRERAEQASQRRKEARQQKKERKERKKIAKQDEKDSSRATETDGYAARDDRDDEEVIETAPGMRQKPRVSERRMAREIIEEIDEPAEGASEYRRPMGLPPFFGLFGR